MKSCSIHSLVHSHCILQSHGARLAQRTDSSSFSAAQSCVLLMASPCICSGSAILHSRFLQPLLRFASSSECCGYLSNQASFRLENDIFPSRQQSLSSE